MILIGFPIGAASLRIFSLYYSSARGAHPIFPWQEFSISRQLIRCRNEKHSQRIENSCNTARFLLADIAFCNCCLLGASQREPNLFCDWYSQAIVLAIVGHTRLERDACICPNSVLLLLSQTSQRFFLEMLFAFVFLRLLLNIFFVCHLSLSSLLLLLFAVCRFWSASACVCVYVCVVPCKWALEDKQQVFPLARQWTVEARHATSMRTKANANKKREEVRGTTFVFSPHAS